MILRLRLSKI